MKLRHRDMQPADIRECVDIMASHPVIGPRYGSAIEDLPEAWLRLIQCEARIAVVVYDEEDPRAPICFPGIGAIVRPDFLHEMKTPPHFWVGPELTRRLLRGDSPLLSGKELREANSGDGLNLVCWESCVRPEYEQAGEVQRSLMSVFIEVCRGYFWREVISAQSWNAEHLDFILKTGGHLWDPVTGGYTSSLTASPGEIISKPHVVGISRDIELARKRDWGASWVGALFDYHRPMLGFTRSEQRLLTCALPGATDEHLAGMLGTSLPAVKKTWSSIYRRVEDTLPELISDPTRSDLPASRRGKEKRRHVLAYLREHPEELRPVSRARDRT